jgi:putative peptidoglycan lipid II flippase
VRGTFRDAIPMMLGLGVLQLNTFLDNLIASWPTIVGPTVLGFDYPLAEGAMSALANAQRLYEFPLGVFGIAIATAIFPVLARLANDGAAFAGAVRRGLRLSMFVGLPASAGLVVVAPEAVGVLFRGGAFDEADVARVATILTGYAPAIWSYQLVHIYTRAFYARRESSTPVRVSLAVVGLNLALNLVLIFTPLREAGLAWSTAICSVVQCAILATLLARRLPGTFGRDVLASWARTLVATGVLVVAVAATLHALPDGTRWRDDLLRLALGVAAGALAFAGAARVLGMPELSELRHRRAKTAAG